MMVLPGMVAKPFPEVIPLLDSFRPEGIVIGLGTTFYVGSIPTGAIYSGDLRTGEGSLLVQPMEGRAAIGLSLDQGSRRLTEAILRFRILNAAPGRRIELYAVRRILDSKEAVSHED